MLKTFLDGSSAHGPVNKLSVDDGRAIAAHIGTSGQRDVNIVLFSGALGEMDVAHAYGNGYAPRHSNPLAPHKPYALGITVPLRNCKLRGQRGPSEQTMWIPAGQAIVDGASRTGTLRFEFAADFVHVCIPSGLMPSHLEKRLENDTLIVDAYRHGEARLLTDLVKSLPAALPELADASIEAVSEYLLCMLTLALRAEKRQTLAGAERRTMADVYYRVARQIIERNLDNPGLSLDYVAAKLRLSKRHTSRVFAGHGTNFRDTVRQCRLRYAAELLATPELAYLRLTDIATMSGFTSVSHFSRSFKTAFGCTPTAYRQRHAAPPLQAPRLNV